MVFVNIVLSACDPLFFFLLTLFSLSCQTEIEQGRPTRRNNPHLSRLVDPHAYALHSNLDHHYESPDVAGLMRVVLSLRCSTLPQTLHVVEPTPEADWQGANMAAVQKRP